MTFDSEFREAANLMSETNSRIRCLSKFAVDFFATWKKVWHHQGARINFPAGRLFPTAVR